MLQPAPMIRNSFGKKMIRGMSISMIIRSDNISLPVSVRAIPFRLTGNSMISTKYGLKEFSITAMTGKTVTALR